MAAKKTTEPTDNFQKVVKRLLATPPRPHKKKAIDKKRKKDSTNVSGSRR
jgi:hypothetical protein